MKLINRAHLCVKKKKKRFFLVAKANSRAIYLCLVIKHNLLRQWRDTKRGNAPLTLGPAFSTHHSHVLIIGPVVCATCSSCNLPSEVRLRVYAVNTVPCQVFWPAVSFSTGNCKCGLMHVEGTVKNYKFTTLSPLICFHNTSHFSTLHF